MFEKGSFVYYGTAGVCKVKDICSSPFGGNDDKMYYVLAANDFDNGTLIYAPVDNDKVVLRAVMTAEEAEGLLASAKTLQPIEVVNEKHRREEYRNALKDGAPETIARVIKTVFLRKALLANTKKRMSDTDAEFDKIARRALVGELSVALGVTAAEAEARLNAAINK